jgi:hypothetical protein
MSDRISVIIRVESGKELETVFAGTITECKAKLFNLVIPSTLTRNIFQIESDHGYHFEVEEFSENKWKKVNYYLQIASEMYS